jgi:alpha-beta hydrolase superfamily lysophospholipase
MTILGVSITYSVRAAPISRELIFKGEGDVELAGTLLLPESATESAPAPAVLIIAGSGPTDRDGNTVMLPLKIDTLKQFAEALAIRGYASFRFDKRVTGAARSKMPAGPAIADYVAFDNFVQDVRLAYKAMVDQPETADHLSVMLGHSEGGLLALLATDSSDHPDHNTPAANDAPDRSPQPAAVVLAASPGRNLGVIIESQIAATLRAQNAPEATTRNLLDNLAAAIDLMKKDGIRLEELHPGLNPLFPPHHEKFLQTLFTHEPILLAQRSTLPVLILQGANDLQISPTLDAQPLMTALESRANSKQQLAIFEGISHNFKPSNGPMDPGFTGQIASEVTNTLADWLDQTLSQKP